MRIFKVVFWNVFAGNVERQWREAVSSKKDAINNVQVNGAYNNEPGTQVKTLVVFCIIIILSTCV